MTIFLLLDGMGVIFLLYVLAEFWKDGHRRKKDARKYAVEFGERDSAEVLVVTHPISHSAQGGLAVIPFRARSRRSDRPAGPTAPNETSNVSAKRISTK